MAPHAPITYGLLGRTLKHSWSPKIHASLGSTPYELIELEPEEVIPFIREETWRGLNVTIPYKRLAAETADVISPRVKALGVANTLIKQEDGSVFADNTDVLGFATMLDDFTRTKLGAQNSHVLQGEKAIVLGTGGAAQAVSYALREHAGANVAFVSRTGTSTYDRILELHKDAVLMVNTTPVGMYPTCPASPLEDDVMSQLKNLLGVLDVVYNPLRTGICLQAEHLGIPYESGLSMLVWQAYHASQLFQGKELDASLTQDILGTILQQTQNIVLIGMPGAGKTTSGRALARLLHRPFIDLDDALEVETGMSAAAYITTYGEEVFRHAETAVLKDYAARSGLVIACGGGVVTRPENYAPLHQNGTIFFLDRPLDELSVRGRPLSQTRGIEQLAQERMGLYRAWADYTLVCTGSPSGDAVAIKALLELE